MNKLIVTAAVLTLTLGACSTAVIENPEEPAAPSETASTPPAETTAPVAQSAPMETNLESTLARVNEALKFEFDDATVPSGAKEDLATLANHLKSENAGRIRIEGYADSMGSEQYNLALSRRRAQAVATEIRNGGFRNIEIKAMGESNPIASNDTDSGRAENRRVNVGVNMQTLGSGR
jgi:outer membrane protein OmpA-like peptidoglycan-associated protein